MEFVDVYVGCVSLGTRPRMNERRRLILSPGAGLCSAIDGPRSRRYCCCCSMMMMMCLMSSNRCSLSLGFVLMASFSTRVRLLDKSLGLEMALGLFFKFST